MGAAQAVGGTDESRPHRICRVGAVSLLREGVLDLLAGILEVGLHLV